MGVTMIVDEDTSLGVISNYGVRLFSNVESRFLPPPDHIPTLTFGSADLQYVWYKPNLNAASEILDQSVLQVGTDKTAIIEISLSGAVTNISYGDLLNRVNQCANGLHALGVRPGNRVLLRFQETIWATVAQLACWKVGAITVPTAVAESPSEISFVIQDTEATAAICDSDFAKPLLSVRGECPTLKWIIGAQEPVADGETSLREFSEKYSEKFEAHTCLPFDASGIYYTGGTTGKPKGCLHTHASEIVLADLNMAARGADCNSVMLTHAPLGHAFGNGEKINFPLRVGATAIYAIKPSPKQMWEIAESYGVTHLAGVATMYRMMLKESPTPLSQYPNLKLQSVLSSGEILDTATINQWTAQGLPLRNTVGMTPMRHLFLESAVAGKHVGPGVSVGQPLPGYEARLVDIDGNNAGGSEAGRLAIRGPSGITYWTNIHPGIKERAKSDVVGGWSLLDDSYSRDEQGWLWFNGRLDDMIVSGGRQIAPVEVETIIATHPNVVEVCVYAASDELRGQVVAAAIVLDQTISKESAQEELHGFIKERLASYKLPRHYEFLSELPKDAVGKIQRRALREQLESKRSRTA